MSIQSVQKKLLAAGFDPGPADGVFGIRTENALDRALTAAKLSVRPMHRSLAWGGKVSAEFRQLVFGLCGRLGMQPNYLMACMAFESGETFASDVRNAAGSGATGLIQFMPATARSLGTTTEALARLTAEQQLAWVERYFLPYSGKLATLSDHYMAILWPAAIGRPETAALWSERDRPTTYRQNAGLDVNRDKVITKAEAASKVEAKLSKGLLPGNVWELV